MGPFLVISALVGILIVLMVRALSRPSSRRTRRGPGAGASGAVYDMLNEDKRKAIEIIVEGRAEYRDPETADDRPESGREARPPRDGAKTQP